MKIKFSLRWNGAKNGKIVTIYNDDELSKMGHICAWFDFVALFVKMLSDANGVPVTLDYRFENKWTDILKNTKTDITKNAQQHYMRTAVQEYIVNHTSPELEYKYEILIEFYKMLEKFNN